MKAHQLRNRQFITADTDFDRLYRDISKGWQRRASRLAARRWQLLNQKLQTHNINERTYYVGSAKGGLRWFT